MAFRDPLIRRADPEFRGSPALPGQMQQSLVLGSIVVIAATTFVAMLFANRLVRFLGLTGANVIARIAGILLAALAMQFVFDGLRESGLFVGS